MHKTCLQISSEGTSRVCGVLWRLRQCVSCSYMICRFFFERLLVPGSKTPYQRYFYLQKLCYLNALSHIYKYEKFEMINRRTKWSINYVINVYAQVTSNNKEWNTAILLESRRKRTEKYKPKPIKRKIKVSSLCILLIALNNVNTADD